MGYGLISNDLSLAQCIGVMCLTLHEKALRLLLHKVISSSIPWSGWMCCVIKLSELLDGFIYFLCGI